MFKGRMLKNEKGFTLIEMMIAGLISIMVLGGSIYVFTKQDKLIRQQNASTILRALGRVAMSELTTEIRRAGYGFPAGQGFVAADAEILTFKANVDDVFTMVTADVANNAPTITVADDTGFQNGDMILIFDASSATDTPVNWETNEINGAPAADVITLLNIAAPPAGSYLREDGIVLHQYQTITYSYDAPNNRLRTSLDLGTTWLPVISKVSAVSFQYFDTTVSATVPLATPVTVANLPTINRIRVNLTLQDDLDSTITLSFNTDINIRNNS